MSVKYLVVSHWHDDHIGGMADLVELCEAACIVLPIAFSRKEFLRFAYSYQDDAWGLTNYGTGEVFRILSRLKDRKYIWAKSGNIILNEEITVKKGRVSCSLYAISPSDRFITDFLGSLGGLLPEVDAPRRGLPEKPDNRASMAVYGDINGIGLLFGADLEEKTGFKGWTDALDEWKYGDTPVQLVKLPHHGGRSAHSERLWSERMVLCPLAMLAPWNKGGRSLPTDDDFDRIRGNTESAYCTAPAEVRRFRHEVPEVRRTLAEGSIELERATYQGSGVTVRYDLGAGSPSWDVELYGQAFKL